MIDPLNQIQDDCSPGSIIRAHRNARTLVWLTKQSDSEKWTLRFAYATHLRVPFDETVWLPEPMDDESLEWVYQRCANWINHP